MVSKLVPAGGLPFCLKESHLTLYCDESSRLSVQLLFRKNKFVSAAVTPCEIVPNELRKEHARTYLSISTQARPAAYC